MTLNEIRNLLIHGAGKTGPLGARELQQKSAKYRGLAARWSNDIVVKEVMGGDPRSSIFAVIPELFPPDTLVIRLRKGFARAALDLTESVLTTFYAGL